MSFPMNKGHIQTFKTENYVPWLIFMVTFALRFYFIPLRDISLDEPFTIFHAQESIGKILKLPSMNEPNPPLFMLLLHFWIKVFGIGQYGARSLSLIFNALNAVFIYLLAKKLSNIRGGLIAAGMFMVSIHQFYFGTEARTYSLLLCATSSAMYYLFSLLIEPSKRKFTAGLILSNLVLVYSHYFGWFTVFMELVTVLICFRNSAALKRTLVVLAITGLAYLPMMKIVIKQFFISKNQTWLRPPSNNEYWNQLVFFMNDRYTIFTACLLLAAGIFYYLFSTRQKKFPVYIYLLFLFWFLPYTIMFLVSGRVPMFENRYVIFNSLGLFVFTATGLAWLFERGKLLILITGIILLSVMSSGLPIHSKEFGYREVQKAVLHLKAIRKKESIILIHPHWTHLGFAYYYNMDMFRNVSKYDSLLKADSVFPVWDITDAREKIKTNGRGQILYYQDGSIGNDPANTIFHYLDSIAVRTDSVFFPQTFYISAFELKTDSIIRNN